MYICLLSAILIFLSSFGIKPTKEKEYHQGVMTTMVDDCQFVCIAQENYYEILSAVSRCSLD